MSFLRQFSRSPWTQRFSGVCAAHYLRFVWKTNRVRIEPPDAIERMIERMPIIMTMWHGQHFLTPFVKPKDIRAKVLVSRHRDGEINAIAANRLGVETIRGSGSHGPDTAGKGGLYGFKALIRALEEGCNVAMTADVPKVSRKAGRGIVKVAQVSGRPIVPVAIATQRRVVLDNWDRTTINLPFGRSALVAGAPIYVPSDANEQTQESARLAVEEALNAATDRAYEIVDSPDGGKGLA
jgi:lysophospholipid acyltransferase (LPLAT)-like uncharacterized protein